MKRRFVLATLVLFCLVGCSRQDNPPAKVESRAAEEATQVGFPIGTAAQEDCALCGSGSLWGYYKKLDSIGVLNLASGSISDLRIFEYEDSGAIKDNSGYSSMMGMSDGDGRYGHLMINGGRGICDLQLSWDAGKEITLEGVASLYCPDCMAKIAELDENWAAEFPDGKRCPFAMIDFVTGEIYSLNGICTTCFIRDYYMDFNFDDREIDGVVVYAPERFPK